MRKQWAWAVVFTAIAACSDDPATLDEAPADPGSLVRFVETFDGNPAAPAPFRSSAWDITKHSRDRDTWAAPEAMLADHGPDCGPPPATHAVTTYDDVVFQCRNHVMTALNASGYGLIYMTPNHLVDFGSGTARVEFSMSTLRSSHRDWVDVWISPYDEHLQLALQDWLPSLSGEPRNGLSIRMDLGSSTFSGAIFRDGVEIELPGTADSFVGYDEFLEPSATRRDRFVLELSSGHIRFGMPEYDHWWVDAAIADLGWSQGVVQFGHHSYTPTKDCGAGESCGPGTWHWDDIVIDPAREFTILASTDRAYSSSQPRVELAGPAPDGAALRFAGIGPNIELSVDGGASWIAAREQPHDPASLVDEHFRSYFTPIPAGTTEVLLRGDSWWGGDWHVRDVSVWAR